MVNWPKQRAWGWYATLIRTPWFCLKLLRFRPYGALSMQRHFHRTEIWWFLKGGGCIEHIIPNRNLHQNLHIDADDIYCWKIKPNEWHKFSAWIKPVYAIEFQYGKKVTETDIERK